jgi:glycosyltransferase involved in cell wall biosynthesis
MCRSIINENSQICFDTRWFGEHGIGRFAFEVCSRLNTTIQFVNKIKPTNPFDVVYLTYKLLTSQYAVWYSPGYNAPLFKLKRYVFTIHDLNHIDLLHNSCKLKRLYYRIVLRHACLRSARVLTVSEFSRRRIVEWSGVDPSHVVNVGNGVSDDFSLSTGSYQPGYPYLLCIGNRKGHKNELRLLRAFATASLDPSIHLLFSGNFSDELLTLASQLGVTERIVFLGRIDEKTLPKVYRGAIALVFPSLYEGFGLPVLESMACGTPVITSNVTALPEVAGDAAIFVDPTDENSISEAIELIVNDENLRAELIIKGRDRVKVFSWDSVAHKIQTVLDEVIAKNKVHP